MWGHHGDKKILPVKFIGLICTELFFWSKWRGNWEPLFGLISDLIRWDLCENWFRHLTLSSMQEHAVSLCECCMGLLRDNNGGVITVSESYFSTTLEYCCHVSVLVRHSLFFMSGCVIGELNLMTLAENFFLFVFQTCVCPIKHKKTLVQVTGRKWETFVMSNGAFLSLVSWLQCTPTCWLKLQLQVLQRFHTSYKISSEAQISSHLSLFLF